MFFSNEKDIVFLSSQPFLPAPHDIDHVSAAEIHDLVSISLAPSLTH